MAQYSFNSDKWKKIFGKMDCFFKMNNSSQISKSMGAPFTDFQLNFPPSLITKDLLCKVEFIVLRVFSSNRGNFYHLG